MKKSQADEGAAIASVKAHAGPVTQLLLDRGGARAVTAGEDGRLVVWDVERMQAIRELAAGVRPWPSALAQGRLVALERGACVSVWDVESGVRVARRQFAGGTWNALMHPDGRRVLVFSAGHSEPNDITVWDFAADHVEASVATEISVEVALVPDGSQVLVGDNCNGVELVGLPGAPSLLLQEPNGFEDEDEDEDEDDEDDEDESEDDDSVMVIAVDGAGLRGASGHISGRVALWDLRTGARLHRLRAHRGEVQAIAFHPDGQRVVTLGGRLAVWDIASGARLVELRAAGKDMGTAVAIDAAGRRCITYGGPAIDVWDLSRGVHAQRLAGHKKHSLARLLPDGERVLSAGGDGLLALWKLREA